MSGGTDKATGLPFGVQYEAPAGYKKVINPITSTIRALESKDTQNSGTTAIEAAETKMGSLIGASVPFKTFDAYGGCFNSF